MHFKLSLVFAVDVIHTDGRTILLLGKTIKTQFILMPLLRTSYYCITVC